VEQVNPLREEKMNPREWQEGQGSKNLRRSTFFASAFLDACSWQLVLLGCSLCGSLSDRAADGTSDAEVMVVSGKYDTAAWSI
jgi:hypothetical protein